MSLLWKHANGPDPYESCDCPGHWFDGEPYERQMSRNNLYLADTMRQHGLELTPLREAHRTRDGSTREYGDPCPECGKRLGDSTPHISLEHGIQSHIANDGETGKVFGQISHRAHFHEPFGYFPHKLENGQPDMDRPEVVQPDLSQPHGCDGNTCRMNQHTLFPKEDPMDSWNPRGDESNWMHVGHVDDPDIGEKIKRFVMGGATQPSVRDHLANCSYHQKMMDEKRQSAPQPEQPKPRENYEDYEY